MPKTRQATLDLEERKNGGKSPKKASGQDGAAHERTYDSELNATHSTTTMTTDQTPGHCQCNDKLDIILEKLKKLDVLEELTKKINSMEREVGSLTKDVQDIKEDLNFMDETVGRKADSKLVSTLTEQIEDLSNRLRRNNLVFLKVPEGSEEASNCATFISNFVVEHMKVPDGKHVQIDRAHRSPSFRTPGKGPRPIHVAFHGYWSKQQVLSYAPRTLKNNPYKGQNVFISEDFTPALQKKRQALYRYKKMLLQENPARRVYITYPAKLKVRDGNNWQIFDYSDEKSMTSLQKKFGRRP